MSSKIDGVPRELLVRILKWLHSDEPDGWASELRALLAAPVVERQSCDFASVLIDTFQFAIDNGKQPTFSKGDMLFFIEELVKFQNAPVIEGQSVAPITEAPDCIKPEMRPAWIDGWNSARTAQMNSAPPELAELQATIARLTAEKERLQATCDGLDSQNDALADEIERLKAGQGEPVAWAIKAGLERISINPKDTHAVFGHSGEGDWDVPLYTSRSVPASVLMPVRKPQRITAAYAEGWNDCLDKVKEMNQ